MALLDTKLLLHVTLQADQTQLKIYFISEVEFRDEKLGKSNFEQVLLPRALVGIFPLMFL